MVHNRFCRPAARLAFLALWLALPLPVVAQTVTIEGLRSAEERSFRQKLTPGITPERLSRTPTVLYTSPGYFGLLAQRLIDEGPVIARFRAAEPEARIVAEALMARMHWTIGDEAGAQAAWARALDLAAEHGIGDRELGFLLADLAVFAFRQGDAAAAQAYLDRALTCPAPDCATDLLHRLRRIPRDGLEVASDAALDGIVEALLDEFPPDWRTAAKGGYLKRHGAALSDDRPTAASRYAERAYFTTPSTDYALDAMRAALVANRFATVERIAAHAANRGQEAEMSPKDRLMFRRLLLRARVRGGDRAAAADYTPLADLVAVLLDSDPEAEGFGWLKSEAATALDDAMDTTNIVAATTILMALFAHRPGDSDLITRGARLYHRSDDSAFAAELLRGLRQARDWSDLTAEAYLVQEAAYARAAGQVDVADALLSTLTRPDFQVRDTGRVPTFELFAWAPEEVQQAIALRDAGNFEGAAWVLGRHLDLVPGLVARGGYKDAQILWQMAYTLARGGEPAAAFQVMSQAAALAARLSFADPTGPEGGTLQLLQRDNWRYLLFIDIAWAAASGKTPEEMMVFSRY